MSLASHDQPPTIREPFFVERSLFIQNQDKDASLCLDDVASDSDGSRSLAHPLFGESEVASIDGFGNAGERDGCVA
jgi:hypothetical protein